MPSNINEFLAQHLATQPHSVMRHSWQGQAVWVKRAGKAHPAWRYRVLGWAAKRLQVDVLRPVPNPGGAQSILTEVERLRSLAKQGVRVPHVLAVAQDASGFVMRDLGGTSKEASSLGDALEQSRSKGSAAVLTLWGRGLQALAQVHFKGACLSQAFARNLILCPDGEVGFIDFEDDPSAHLPIFLCQARDILCYAHSSAWLLAPAPILEPARVLWRGWLGAYPAPVRRAVQQAVEGRVGQLMRRLPTTQRLGRDAWRARQAWELLHP